MNLTPQQTAYLLPLLNDKKAIDARITEVVGAFLISAGIDPAAWQGHIHRNENETIQLVLPEQVDDAAP